MEHETGNRYISRSTILILSSTLAGYLLTVPLDSFQRFNVAASSLIGAAAFLLFERTFTGQVFQRSINRRQSREVLYRRIDMHVAYFKKRSLREEFSRSVRDAAVSRISPPRTTRLEDWAV